MAELTLRIKQNILLSKVRSEQISIENARNNIVRIEKLIKWGQPIAVGLIFTALIFMTIYFSMVWEDLSA